MLFSKARNASRCAMTEGCTPAASGAGGGREGAAPAVSRALLEDSCGSGQAAFGQQCSAWRAQPLRAGNSACAESDAWAATPRQQLSADAGASQHTATAHCHSTLPQHNAKNKMLTFQHVPLHLCQQLLLAHIVPQPIAAVREQDRRESGGQTSSRHAVSHAAPPSQCPTARGFRQLPHCACHSATPSPARGMHLRSAPAAPSAPTYLPRTMMSPGATGMVVSMASSGRSAPSKWPVCIVTSKGKYVRRGPKRVEEAPPSRTTACGG